jgi:hypothetical protein
MAGVAYNGYTFGEYSHFNIEAVMVEDDSQRTVTYHRYRVTVTTIIVAEIGDSTVGDHYKRMRQRLTKQGQDLYIDHAGFGPPLKINAGYGPRDVAFGPKPRILRWEPVGATNSVEVVWECEFCLPTCEGDGLVRYQGISAINYSIHTRVDKFGYTVRTISGYLEIAMTRLSQFVPDTADAYRDVVVVPKPVNFTRETTWNLSLDKRRADFSITDTEIPSPNAYPAGVIEISAHHAVDWHRRESATLRNVIRADITLAPNKSRALAWEIFRAICASRFQYCQWPNWVFMEAVSVNEDLYRHTMSFGVTYRIIDGDTLHRALRQMFTHTGLGQKLSDDWISWSQGLVGIQDHYGIANLRHQANQDQIVDLCTIAFLQQTTPVNFVPYTPPSGYLPLTTPYPPPDRSYLKFDSGLNAIEKSNATSQTTIGGDDLQEQEFSASDPGGRLGLRAPSGSGGVNAVERFVEPIAADIEFEWSGYAERAGYLIPRPRKLTVNGVTLVRKGISEFKQKLIAVSSNVPIYGASWVMRFGAITTPEELRHDDLNPWEVPPAT